MKVALTLAFCLVPRLEAVVIEAADKESPPDPNQVPLPAVPSVADAGKSGFPELPTVSAMLDESTHTLSGISSQAQKLQQQMLEVQQENAARMQRQKAVFDRKLKEQEQKNLDVVKENAVMAKRIMDMKNANEELLQHAQALQKGNSLRHGELKMLQEQLTAGQSFLEESLAKTDDSKADDLEVLKSDQVEAKGLSLLEISETPSKEDVSNKKAQEPESLLSMLSDEVKVMKKQGQDSEAKLKGLFRTAFQTGVRRHKALLSQQKVLQETLEKMQSYRTRLEAADKHLQGTQSSLDTRIRDGGLFMQKLSELSMAKPEAAVQALQSLKQKK
ncbi:unnamed protein product [Effrenium voratum]|uniref:Uncharacterized protein n=1 Tax=Effrenium voratum TaxID=2562239 RepID=A0AA36HSN8_9DINO|nr:unnamed protein product [Effrenium voratum]CAJ1440159.1 unnamed protein product [Effrenium voratum]